jgi:hypothetical protein
MGKRFNLVRCRQCKKIVGADHITKEIERCYRCHKGSGARRGQKVTAVSNFARVKKGPAPDLPEGYRNYIFRSGWERNFARWLCLKGVKWTFERVSFPFVGYKYKPHIYIPDFYEVENDVIWEVKGYLRPDDRSRMTRFKKVYPEEFKKMKVCLSKSNKRAIAFYQKMDIFMLFIEDVEAEYKRLVSRTRGTEDHWE